jgi:hypothetical protein
MLGQRRLMPVGVLLFLLYGFAMLAGLAVAMPLVIDQAVEAPVSPLGIVYMLLLAYLIFTLTLVLQRKQAGYPLAIGLATLSVPLVPILYLSPAGAPGAIVTALFAVGLFVALRRDATRAWFVEL